MVSGQCEECKSTNLKSNTNYSHGKKSKSTTTFTCKDCGSYKVKMNVDKFKGRGRR